MEYKITKPTSSLINLLKVQCLAVIIAGSDFCAVVRVGNLGLRIGFVSTRLARLHIRVQHEPNPIINQVKTCNPDTTQL
jgi:hypothetical protein